MRKFQGKWGRQLIAPKVRMLEMKMLFILLDLVTFKGAVSGNNYS